MGKVPVMEMEKDQEMVQEMVVEVLLVAVLEKQRYLHLLICLHRI